MAESTSDRNLIAVALSLLIIFTVLGNSLVLGVLFCKARRLLKKPLYLFICNICLSDVLASLFTMTFEVSEELTHEWLFGEPACKFIQYLELTLFGVNIFTHLFIALERYRNVVQPLKLPMKARVAKILVALSWGIPSLMALPYLYTLRVVKLSGGKGICTIAAMPWKWLDKLYLSVELLVVFLIPLSLIVWMYIIIVRKLYQRRRQANAVLPQPTQMTMRAAAVHGSRVSVAVVIVFVSCWLPFVVVYFVRLVNGLEGVDRTSPLFVTALYASFASELFTPLLYCAFDRNIKPALIDTLKCRLRSVLPSDDSVSDQTVPPLSRCATLVRQTSALSRDVSCSPNCGIRLWKVNIKHVVCVRSILSSYCGILLKLAWYWRSNAGSLNSWKLLVFGDIVFVKTQWSSTAIVYCTPHIIYSVIYFMYSFLSALMEITGSVCFVSMIRKSSNLWRIYSCLLKNINKTFSHQKVVCLVGKFVATCYAVLSDKSPSQTNVPVLSIFF